MLNPICTVLMYSNLCLVGTNLKLIVCTNGQTFHDPLTAVNKSAEILAEMAARESPVTSPR